MDDVTVLLITENPACRRSVQDLLAADSSPYRLLEAPDPASGANRIRRSEIDVVLLDLADSSSDGLAGFHRFRDSIPGTPVVVLTTQNDRACGVSAVQEGAADFLIRSELNEHRLTRSLWHAVNRGGNENQDSDDRASPPSHQEGVLVFDETPEETVVRFTENRIVDPETVEEVKVQLCGLVDHGCRKLVLDLNGVEYLSNTAFAIPVALHQKLSAAGGSLRLCRVSPEVRKHLASRGLHRLFRIDAG